MLMQSAQNISNEKYLAADTFFPHLFFFYLETYFLLLFRKKSWHSFLEGLWSDLWLSQLSK